MSAKTKSGTFNRSFEPWLYLLPFIFGIVVFTLYPVINVVLISFKEGYRLLTGAFDSIGVENYLKVISDPYFINGIKNTAIYVITVVPIATAISLFFANLLNQKIKGIAIFHTAYFLPLVTSATAVGLVWKLMFNGQFGVINYLLGIFNIGPFEWITDPRMNIYTLIIYGIWNMIPFTTILLLSGLQNIDPLYYTAAKVDGASSSKMFFRITVPLLAPTIGLTCVVNTISASKVYGELFPLFNGRPGIARNLYTVVFYIYEKFYVDWDLGRAAAASIILFLIIFVFTMIQLQIQKRWKYY